MHGANRLASNSLLEGLVFAERIAAVLGTELTRNQPSGQPPAAEYPPPQGHPPAVLLDPAIVRPLQQLMSANAGVLRSGDGLAAAAAGLAELGRAGCDKPGAASWQATNLHLIATALVKAALAREETRGSHWREDFGQASEMWRGHLVSSLDSAGLSLVFEPVLDE